MGAGFGPDQDLTRCTLELIETHGIGFFSLTLNFFLKKLRVAGYSAKKIPLPLSRENRKYWSGDIFIRHVRGRVERTAT
ncbi:hypothetical protein AD949_03375 [Acetobacter orleanensis]|nr:hypothetical protein AD949_03375 [Acetobacter orleanensis]PCD79598.1 hypothetical protein CO710_05105 [Acetobacter orleanensis]